MIQFSALQKNLIPKNLMWIGCSLMILIHPAMSVEAQLLAQHGAGTRSVDMLPGTTAKEQPHPNQPPARAQANQSNEVEIKKVNTSELRLKRSRWAKPKKELPKQEASPPPIRPE